MNLGLCEGILARRVCGRAAFLRQQLSAAATAHSAPAVRRRASLDELETGIRLWLARQSLHDPLSEANPFRGGSCTKTLEYGGDASQYRPVIRTGGLYVPRAGQPMPSVKARKLRTIHNIGPGGRILPTPYRGLVKEKRRSEVDIRAIVQRVSVQGEANSHRYIHGQIPGSQQTANHEPFAV